MAANATLSLAFTSSSLPKHKPQFGGAPKRFASCSAGPSSFSSSSSLCLVAGRSSKARAFTASSAAAVDEETVVDGGEHVEEETGKQARATEVYVCNLPRSCDTEQLLHMFNPHGTVLSAEVCRSAETGESRGSAFVTMASINSAKNAIAALDGSDVGGREMRVRFSAEMNPRRRNLDTMNSSPKRVIYYEGPHKLYVGNLSRAARPDDLRQLFGRFGNVASVRVLQDLRQGKRRVYAFVSYLSKRERDAAMSLHGTVKSASATFHCCASCFICLCLIPSLVFLSGILWSYASD
ncbi:28 kDa ribonucleoprotein [Spatholobus suberectus]|nr:28 kDa ribonucleoprotein [Spatholobus suberectus]